MQFRSVLKVFALAASLSLLVACGGDDDDDGGTPTPVDPPMSILGECPAGTDTTAGEALFMEKCMGCHSGFAQAATRAGNPAGANCSDGNNIAECMYERALDNSMPLAPQTALTEAEEEPFRLWLACNQ